MQIASYNMQTASYKVPIAFCGVHSSSSRPDMEAVRAGPSSKMQFKMHSTSNRIKRLYEPLERYQ